MRTWSECASDLGEFAWGDKMADYKVAVVGTYNAGKSVFLTSLLTHLSNHKHEDFSCIDDDDKKVQIDRFKFLPKEMKPAWQTFKLAAYRQALADSQDWPKKTDSTAHYICQFRRGQKLFGMMDAVTSMHFVDIAGERIADAEIALQETYADWSDALLDFFKTRGAYAELAQPYFDCMAQNGSPAALIRAYKTFLYELRRKKQVLISPSTFLISADDDEGRPKIVKSASREDFLNSEIDERMCGLHPDGDTDRQFVPMSKAAREAQPELADQFAKHYAAYRKTVVEPVFEHLWSADRLLVLVDIPSILNSNEQRLNEERRLLEMLFKNLKPPTWWQWITTSRKELKRVAFVATKADIIYPKDRPGLKLLLRAMAGRYADAAELESNDVEYFVCSAIECALKGDAEYEMRAFWRQPDKTLKEQLFYVDPLPRAPTDPDAYRFPDEWAKGAFRYPKVMPRMPKSETNNPRQFGLDAVFKFISEG